MQETPVQFLDQEDPLENDGLPTPVFWGFPGDAMVKNLSAKSGDTGDVGLTPVLGKSPGEGNGNPLQYSCLENPMDRGAWRATVCGVAESQTRLSN